MPQALPFVSDHPVQPNNDYYRIALSFSVNSAQHVYLRNVDLTEALETGGDTSCMKEFWVAPFSLLQTESLTANKTKVFFRIYGKGFTISASMPSYRTQFLHGNGTVLFSSPWAAPAFEDYIEFEFDVDDVWMSGTYQLRLMQFAHEVPHWPAIDTLPLNTIDFSAIPAFNRRVFITSTSLYPKDVPTKADTICQQEGGDDFVALVCLNKLDSAATRVAEFSLSPSFPARWFNHYDDSLVFSPRKTQSLTPFTATGTFLEGPIRTLEGSSSVNVLTGCQSSGDKSWNCQNWGDTSSQYYFGSGDSLTISWMIKGLSACTMRMPTYCISKLSVEERVHSQLEAILDGQMLPYTVLL